MPNPALVEVLALFLLHPEEEIYQREITERTGNARRQVQRALQRIERAGLVTKARRDRDLADSAIKEISADRRFATAYNAVLQLATIALRYVILNGA